MNASQEKALLYLTGTAKLELVQEETLVQMAHEHPYFAPIQLFLAEKWKQSGATQFPEQAQKTNLYFTNPYWLHYQLSEHQPLPLLTNNTVNIEPSEQVTAEEEVLPTIQKATPEINKIEISLDNDPIPTNSNQASSGFTIPTVEYVKEMMRNIDKQPTIASIEEAIVPALIEPLEDSKAATVEEEIEAAPVGTASDQSNNKISSLLSGQLAAFKKPITEADQLGLPTETMHTVDYFASQGIKIDLSKIPQDKLTTQLRRFTDWLKYMKNDNPNPVDLGTHRDLEEAVEMIAKSSNVSKEVLTESMADVLQKQGQIDKAIQLYIKLSFLNPEKSAYFAAKIQHLKGIQ